VVEVEHQVYLVVHLHLKKELEETVDQVVVDGFVETLEDQVIVPL
tara:strand:+ start:19 stop:153 length:135 start_codon:yes stop_codon:yes gene_type:complete